MYQQNIFNNLNIFHNDDAIIIQELAKALDEDDILDVYNTNMEDLAEQAEDNDDFTFFTTNWRKGRLDGKRKAVNCLMDGLKSPDVAMKYLKQLTQSWPDAETGKGGSAINLTIGLDDFNGSDSAEAK